MRQVQDASRMTPFSLWIRERCKSSDREKGCGLSVTNLDFVIEDFLGKKLMILEEKRRMGGLKNAQSKTIQLIDEILGMTSRRFGYEYWGFYVLRLVGDEPGPGMLLNGKEITEDQLIRHMNFETKFCERVKWSHPYRIEICNGDGQ